MHLAARQQGFRGAPARFQPVEGQLRIKVMNEVSALAQHEGQHQGIAVQHHRGVDRPHVLLHPRRVLDMGEKIGENREAQALRQQPDQEPVSGIGRGDPGRMPKGIEAEAKQEAGILQRGPAPDALHVPEEPDRIDEHHLRQGAGQRPHQNVVRVLRMMACVLMVFEMEVAIDRNLDPRQQDLPAQGADDVIDQWAARNGAMGAIVQDGEGGIDENRAHRHADEGRELTTQHGVSRQGKAQKTGQGQGDGRHREQGQAMQAL